MPELFSLFAVFVILFQANEISTQESPNLELTIGSTSIFAKWSQGTLNSSLIYSYQLSLLLGSTARLLKTVNSTTADPASTLLDGLTPESTYFVRLAATGADRRALGKTVEQTVKTKPLGSSASLTRPSTPTPTSIGKTSVDLEWRVQSADGIVRFLVEYDSSGGAFADYGVSVVDDVRVVSNVTVNGLTPGTQYFFRVVSVRTFSQQIGDVLSFKTVAGGEGESDVPVGYIVGIAVLGVLLLAVSIILVVFCCTKGKCSQRKTADDTALQPMQSSAGTEHN